MTTSELRCRIGGRRKTLEQINFEFAGIADIKMDEWL
jgi:hypothetical protein